MSRWYDISVSVGGAKSKKKLAIAKRALSEWVDKWDKDVWYQSGDTYGVSGEGEYNSTMTSEGSVANSMARALAVVQKQAGVLELQVSIVDRDSIPWESFIFRDDTDYAEAKLD